MKNVLKNLLMLIAFIGLAFVSCEKNEEPVDNSKNEPEVAYQLFQDQALGAYLEYNMVPTIMDADSGFVFCPDSVKTTTDLYLSKTSTSIEDLTNDDVKHADVKITAFPELKYFTGATHLTLTSNELTELDLTANTSLKVLQMNYNHVNALDLSALTQLDSLRYKGDIDEISFRLASIDLSNNTALTHLYLPRHNISEIDLSGLTNLTYVDLSDNPGVPFVVPDAIYTKLTVAEGVIDQTTADQTIYKHVTIPDAKFGALLMTNAETPCIVEEEGVFYLDTIKAKETLRLNVSGSSSDAVADAITDFTGIEYFTNMTYFKFNYAAVTSLDLSKNPMIDSVHHTGIKNVAVENYISSITFADESKIKYIQLYRNALTAFDATTFTSLTYLNLRDGLITTGNLAISETANTALERVRVNGNADDPIIISAAAYDMLKANSYYSAEADPDAALDGDGLASGE